MRRFHPYFVFVHGLGGFAEIRLLGKRVACFRQVKAMLEDQGLTAYFPALPTVGSVAERAQTLAAYISHLPREQCYLVAHSMGGLDCRYFLSKFDIEHRVLGLATIATPHQGTPLADWLLTAPSLGAKLVRPWLRKALEDLTVTACQRFNDTFPNRFDVRYLSYAGVRPVMEMPPWFRPWTRLLDKCAGDNDSQVPLTSATWGEFKGIVRADHLELLGWNFACAHPAMQRPFNHLSLYQRIVTDLLATPKG